MSLKICSNVHHTINSSKVLAQSVRIPTSLCERVRTTKCRVWEVYCSVTFCVRLRNTGTRSNITHKTVLPGGSGSHDF